MNDIPLPSWLSEEILPQLMEHPKVERVVLFGSRARGDANVTSDYDLAVAAPQATSREWVELWYMLKDAPTLLEVDVIRIEEVGKELQQRIEQEGCVLFERSEGGTEPCKLR